MVRITAMARSSLAVRFRGGTLLILLTLVAVGLGSRRPGLPEVVTLYVGDVTWGAFFFFGFRLLWPRLARFRLWLLAVGTTELIELSQLWRAPWLERIRSTRLGGLMLGHEFLVSDMVCVALGASLAALMARRFGSKS